ncbi:MAG: cupin domain-containing protein, partial [Betaproteobacteria bacterium]
YIAFGFVESPPGHGSESASAQHEMFLYVINGALEATVGKEKRRAKAGDVIQIPKNERYALKVAGTEPVRYAAVRSTPRLESAIAEKGAADNWRG